MNQTVVPKLECPVSLDTVWIMASGLSILTINLHSKDPWGLTEFHGCHLLFIAD